MNQHLFNHNIKMEAMSANEPQHLFNSLGHYQPRMEQITSYKSGSCCQFLLLTLLENRQFVPIGNPTLVPVLEPVFPSGTNVEVHQYRGVHPVLMCTLVSGGNKLMWMARRSFFCFFSSFSFIYFIFSSNLIQSNPNSYSIQSHKIHNKS